MENAVNPIIIEQDCTCEEGDITLKSASVQWIPRGQRETVWTPSLPHLGTTTVMSDSTFVTLLLLITADKESCDIIVAD
jgi:hypothetical protein